MIDLNHSRKVAVRRRSPVLLLIPICGVLVGEGEAQTFTKLHDFTPSGSDLDSPVGHLISLGDTLYGTTAGTFYAGDNGSVFSIKTDGSGFTNLHIFTATSAPIYTNSDGANPQAGLVQSGNVLYGTTEVGGSSGSGTIFRLNTDGSGFTVLHSFTRTPDFSPFVNEDGANPQLELIVSSNTLYGAAYLGGTSGNGTVFAVNTDGSGFTNLHSLTTSRTNSLGFYTNSDGVFPQTGLVLSDGVLYGAATSGGSSGNGTVFKLNTDGTGFENLHSFSKTSGFLHTNIDGSNPSDHLVLSDSTLYGSAGYGGSSGNGTMFKLNADGTGFLNLHSFTGLPFHTNSDGAGPSLLVLGQTIYATAAQGGIWNNGTIFTVNIDGTGFRTLYHFTGGSDGGGPSSGLISSGNTFYGTTTVGGTGGSGTLFSISLPPQLIITRRSSSISLSWPTNFTGFTLQSTTNLASTVWSTNLPAPLIANGQFTVSNPISGTQQFFRLSQ